MFMSSMELNKIQERLAKVVALVEQWQMGGEMPTIERDLALEELRRAYDELLGVDVQPREFVETCEESVAGAGAAPSAGELFDEVLDIDALLGLTDDSEPATEPQSDVESISEPEVAPEPEVVSEPDIIPLSEVEPVVVPEPEAILESEPESLPDSEPAKAVVEQTTTTLGGGLFDIEDIPVRSKSRKIISLYGTPANPAPSRVVEPVATELSEPVVQPATVAQPEPEPIVGPKPQPQPAERLADVLGGGVTVLGDKMATEEPTAPFNRIDDLHKAISLNDKFLMINDLFGGDAGKYEDTINTLNEFEDLDECMIYIVENFAWNPDLEGAKLLVSLIERKLS